MKNKLDDTALAKQISNMNDTELQSFLLTLRIIAFMCTTVGVSVIILALCIPDILLIAGAFIVLSFAGNFAITTDNIISFVKLTLDSKTKS